MTKLLHGMGKVVTGDSGFCVTAGMIALAKHGVHSQFSIKRQWFWPKGVPGDSLDSYMRRKEFGETMTYVQHVDNTCFLIHCFKDWDYVMKMMSSHGLLDENPDHKTYRLVGGVWKSFHYAKPFSRHNRAKHWVDDINQNCHGDIGLDEVWATKWWPNRQFTFLLLIAEVNVGQARARATGETAEPSLEFRKKMAHKMLTNKLSDYGVTGGSPARVWRRESNKHVHWKWAKHEGM